MIIRLGSRLSPDRNMLLKAAQNQACVLLGPDIYRKSYGRNDDDCCDHLLPWRAASSRT